MEAVLFARDRDITMIAFPPHFTHKIQPLDVSLFELINSAYNVEAGNWMSSNPGRRNTAFEIAFIFVDVYNRFALYRNVYLALKLAACGHKL